MGKRGKFTAGILAMMAALGLVAWLVWPEREPIFHGQRLGKFLAQPLPTNSFIVSMRFAGGMFSGGSSGVKERFTPGTGLTGQETGSIGTEDKYVNEEQAAINEAGVAALPALLHQ